MRRRFQRLPVWAFALLLAFKAAVPMLASVAASAQGRGVAEICSVYGVALPGASNSVPAMAGPHAGHEMGGHAMAGPSHAGTPEAAHGANPASVPAHQHAPEGGHGGDHCALTAVMTLAPGLADAAALPQPALAQAVSGRFGMAAALPADGAALWAARLGHGPPLFS